MKGNKKPKASKATVLLRLLEIVRIRLDGAKLWDVSEYVREQEQTEGSPWKLADGDKPLSERQIARYVRRADDTIAVSTRERRRQALVKQLARREHMYAKAMNAGDVRTALAVAQDEAKLRNLYPPKRTELTGKAGGPLQYDHVPTDAERAAGITALLDRARARRDGPAASGAAPPVAAGPAQPPPAGGLPQPG
jgi:hypothetical protein